jgi:O-acetyl-ADP-ribose deacetylase (regulator of RNase III)
MGNQPTDNQELCQMPECASIQNCSLRLVQQDITDFEVEAIVFYARVDLALGSGFGSAITRRGGPSIKAELDKIGSINPTEAVVTTGGNLKARYIVHAAGPAFQEEQIEDKLRTTILRALRLAEEKGIRQIALPPMGAGFYGIPLPSCRELMIGAFEQYLAKGGAIKEIVICANDAREYRAFQGAFQNLNRNSAAGKSNLSDKRDVQ